MIIIGLAGKNRMAKGSCALHLHESRGYRIIPPDQSSGTDVASAIRDLQSQGKPARIVIAHVLHASHANAVRAMGGIVVHVIGPRDQDCQCSGIEILPGEFVLHGCADDPREMHAQLDCVVANHELSILTEMRRHASA